VTPLDGAYCNALLLAHWSVRQKLNRVSSVQLRPSVRTFNTTSLQRDFPLCDNDVDDCVRLFYLTMSSALTGSLCVTTVGR